MDTPTNYISLYSGGGGLDLGFRLANPGARAVCYVEIDAAACAVLVSHMQSGELDDAPVWTDSGTFDGRPWRDRVDWLIGGFPCQPWSVAGSRTGTDDERWLWPHISRLVREIRPRGLFLENVPGLLYGGIEHVLGDLAALGFDAEWTAVRASDVGAPHRRERIFILAHRGFNAGSRESGPKESEPISGHRIGVADSERSRRPQTRQRQHKHARGQSETGCGDVADTACAGTPRLGKQRWQGSPQRNKRSEAGVADDSGILGDSQSTRPQGRERPGRSADESLSFPPGPSDADAWSGVLAQRPEIEPAICGMADGMAYRVDRLRILGNGVVPAQAARAFEELTGRLTQDIIG